MGTSNLEKVRRPQSLTTLVTDQIRDLIISDKLSLGEQLSEQDLSEQLGVSRTPVREAFQRLEMERLVEIRPQRGTYVFRYDITELREISELREILETGALRMAIAHHPDLLSRVLSEKLEEAEAALAQGPAGFQSYDSAFHESLVRASHNREIIEAYLRVSGRIRAIRFRLTRTDELTRSAQKDHRAITRLVVARKYEEAELRVGKHVYNGYRTFVATLKAEDSVGPSAATSHFRR
jgi:DNA-binding GntR family transcriptional regulator